MAVEKGQKYRANPSGFEYTILTEPFETPKGTKVSYWDHTAAMLLHVDPSSFERGSYTLIREPKFKVGDRVTIYGDSHKVVAVSSEADIDGDIAYLVKDVSGQITQSFQYALKAAE